MAAAAMKKTTRLQQGLQDDFPEEIIQHIQSYLPEEDAVRSSLLSKSWKHAQSTLPSLRFHQSRFGLPMVFQYHKPEDSPETKELRQRFAKFVDDTLVRYHHSKLLVEKFHLSVEIAAGSEFDFRVQTWLRLVSQMGIKHLSLTALTKDDTCTIPFEIFSSKALRTLKIGVLGCGKPLPCPCNSRIECFSLQVLELRKVHISDKLMDELVSNCPLLEKITLAYCNGFGRIHVRDLHRLQVFDISALEGEVVEIDAPSLRSFTYCGKEGLIRHCSFNIDASTSLTRLQLGGVAMESRSFEKFISKFPLLEELKIRVNYTLEEIDIACPNLRELSISICPGLEYVKVHAPKLVSFVYVGGPIPSFDFPGVDADKLKAKLILERRDEFHDDSYFLWLSEALHISRNLSIYLKVSDISLMVTGLANFRGNVVLPLQNIKELWLRVYGGSHDSAYFMTTMDAFFTVCRPRYIKVFRGDEELCNFLLNELMDRRTLSSCTYIRNVQVSLMHIAVPVDEKNDDNELVSLMERGIDDRDVPKLLTVPWRDLTDGSQKYPRYVYVIFDITWSS